MNKDNKKVGAVMVIGGGIGGIQASLDLANSGYKVYLLENKPSIGGVMAQLDKTFPTNDCAMCILSPKLVECGRHKDIQLISYADIREVRGKAGNFKVKIEKYPRFIEEDKCTGCGECAEVCPVEVKNEFEQGLVLRKAIYRLYPQAIPNIFTIDEKECSECLQCIDTCKAEAINHYQTNQEVEIEVGSVILTPGAETFDPELKDEYGYSRYPNVITSLEFERILSASGPYAGKLLRPGDKKIAEKIAWIQCVGSRDESVDKGYCSSICCMYTAKQAIIAKEHAKKVEATVFYMDMRAYGKGFQRYVDEAESRYKVRYIRSRISEVRESPESGSLLVKYETEAGKLLIEEFDLVVLSVGLSVSNKLRSLAQVLGLELNEYGFCKTDEFSPVKSSRNGIFVAGSFQSPQAIPETVIQASAAASSVAELLKEERGKLIKKEKFIPEIDVDNKPPRVGVFICHCGINIGSYLNVPQVVEYARGLPGVVFVEDNLYACSEDTQRRIQQVIIEYNLNKVVVASCTPRTHEFLFQKNIQQIGLNPYLFQMVNIREQCSWCHMETPQEATEKAKDLIKMATAKAKLLEPLYPSEIPVTQKAVVIGAGLAGMTAALSIADQGFEVYLLERENQLGGNLRKIHYTLENNNLFKFLSDKIEQVEKNPLIKIYKGIKITNSEGFVGNFKITIKMNSGIKILEAGVVIITTGAKEEKPSAFLYGEDKRVYTQLELENNLAEGQNNLKEVKSVIMIQCVGSRDKIRPYCSRVCCSQAIKNALRLKEEKPDINIFILYRDICTFGFREKYYRKAREKGIVFIRYQGDRKPKILRDGEKIKLEVEDLVLKQKFILDVDLLILAPPIIPLESNRELSRMFKVPLNEDDFFLEAHVKLRPVDFATDGVFVAGLAHFPKCVDETISQAKAAASRACLILSKPQIISGAHISYIDEVKCIGCGLCQQSCPFEAIELKNKKVLDKDKIVAEVNKVLCKGCGICAASCRPGAIDLKGFTNEQIVSQIIELKES